MKTAQTTEEAAAMQDKKEGQPHAWVQWKGTDVCMDVHCECGAHLHVDGYFAHHVQCPHCEATYMCSPCIELIKLAEPPGFLTIVAESDPNH